MDEKSKDVKVDITPEKPDEALKFQLLNTERRSKPVAVMN